MVAWLSKEADLFATAIYPGKDCLHNSSITPLLTGEHEIPSLEFMLEASPVQQLVSLRGWLALINVQFNITAAVKL